MKRNEIYRFLLTCTSVHEPYNYCGTLARELNKLLPYDQARVIFFDISGKIVTSLLYGVKKNSWNIHGFL